MGVDMVLRVHPGLDLEDGRTEFDPSLAGQDANQPSPVNQVLTIETVAYLGQSEVLGDALRKPVLAVRPQVGMCNGHEHLFELVQGDVIVMGLHLWTCAWTSECSDMLI